MTAVAAVRGVPQAMSTALRIEVWGQRDATGRGAGV